MTLLCHYRNFFAVAHNRFIHLSQQPKMCLRIIFLFAAISIRIYLTFQCTISLILLPLAIMAPYNAFIGQTGLSQRNLENIVIKGIQHKACSIPMRRGKCIRAVAVPVAPSSGDSDSTEYRKQLAESYGFRQIGEPLPDNVTLRNVIDTLPKEVLFSDSCIQQTHYFIFFLLNLVSCLTSDILHLSLGKFLAKLVCLFSQGRLSYCSSFQCWRCIYADKISRMSGCFVMYRKSLLRC